MSNRVTSFLRWLIYYPVMVFLCLEAALLIMGYERFKNHDYSIQSSPKNALIGHPELGIQLNPGRYTIRVNQGLVFNARHTGTHSRYVAPVRQNLTEVLLLGCSFTYGFGVNDDQTFASLLQNRFPETGIRNCGVPGYGSAQSLLQLKALPDSTPLKVVLLHFSSLHFMRNTLSQPYRSNLKIGYKRSSKDVDNLMQSSKFPYKSSCNGALKFASWESMYTNWPGREWSAAINALQTAVDHAMEDHARQVEVTACLLREMQEICAKKGVTFGVVCLDTTHETRQLKKRLEGINWLDINFNFNNTAMINHPYDSHPNPAGHQFIATEIQGFLAGLLHEN